MADIAQLVEQIVPDVVANLLVSVCESTGLQWGVMSRREYFFQSPKLHIVLFIVAALFCAALWQMSKNYRGEAIARLTTRGAGWSLKCPINTLIAVVLMGCFAMQVYTKGSRPKPFVQLGWLFMPCHMTTLAWIYILLRQRPQHYGNNCYIATLLIDWLFTPIGAIASPDWGDHQFAFEGQVFFLHHALLVALPVYYAARYHTEPLSKKHVLHFTWVPTLLNFAIKTPLAMLFGLNIDYMLFPPPVKGIPAVFHSVYYRVPYVPLFVLLGCTCNVGVRFIAEAVAALANLGKKAKRKIS